MGETFVSNTLTPQLLSQIFKQESEDPFLTLITFSHTSFSTIRLVNNSEDVVSRGNTFSAFPIKITFPSDDGESSREMQLEMDNVSLELLNEIRTATTTISVLIELILFSTPNEVQVSFEDLKIQSVNYDSKKISARLFLDSFLTTNLTSEIYGPSNYPGLF